MEFQRTEEGEDYWLSNVLPDVKEEFEDYEEQRYRVMFESDSLYVKDRETESVTRYPREEDLLEDVEENSLIEDMFNISPHINWNCFNRWEYEGEFYVWATKTEWVSAEEPVELDERR